MYKLEFSAYKKYANYALLVFIFLYVIPPLRSQQLVHWPGGNICEPEKVEYGAPIFQEDFNGNKLDASRWRTHFHCGGMPYDSDDCYYSRTHGEPGHIYRDENIRVANGKCTISLKREEGKWFHQTSPYTSGVIESIETFSHYSRFEIMADFPDGDGVWPNFWMFGYGTEFDVAEYNEDTDKYLIAVHRFDKGLTRPDWCCTFVKKDYPITRSSQLYAVEYEPYRIKFYLNDEIVGIMPRFTTLSGEEVKECRYYEPQMLIEHNAWPEYGHPLNIIADISTLKANAKTLKVNEDDLVIDYIKVYQRDIKRKKVVRVLPATMSTTLWNNFIRSI